METKTLESVVNAVPTIDWGPDAEQPKEGVPDAGDWYPGKK